MVADLRLSRSAPWIAALLLFVATSATADAPEGDLCFVPSAANGNLVTVECATYGIYPCEYVGYDTAGSPCVHAPDGYPCYPFSGPFGWTLSASPVDPSVNEGALDPIEPRLYLWLLCARGDGMAAAEFSFGGSLEPSIATFLPTNGFLNAGTGTELLLAVGGCPQGPVVAGYFVLTGTIAVEPTSWGSLRAPYR